MVCDPYAWGVYLMADMPDPDPVVEAPMSNMPECDPYEAGREYVVQRPIKLLNLDAQVSFSGNREKYRPSPREYMTLSPGERVAWNPDGHETRRLLAQGVIR